MGSTLSVVRDCCRPRTSSQNPQIHLFNHTPSVHHLVSGIESADWLKESLVNLGIGAGSSFP